MAKNRLCKGAFMPCTGVASRFTTRGKTRICHPQGTRTRRKASPTWGVRGHAPLGKSEMAFPTF